MIDVSTAAATIAIHLEIALAVLVSCSVSKGYHSSPSFRLQIWLLPLRLHCLGSWGQDESQQTPKPQLHGECISCSSLKPAFFEGSLSIRYRCCSRASVGTEIFMYACIYVHGVCACPRACFPTYLFHALLACVLLSLPIC